MRLDVGSNQKAEQPVGTRAGNFEEFDYWLPRNREIRKAFNIIIENKAADWSQDVLRENVIGVIFRKNYLIAQKAEYMRFANQINGMVANSK